MKKLFPLFASVFFVACSVAVTPTTGDDIMRQIHSSMVQKIDNHLPEAVIPPLLSESSFAIEGMVYPSAVTPLESTEQVEFAIAVDQWTDMRTNTPEMMMDVAGYMAMVGGDTPGYANMAASVSMMDGTPNILLKELFSNIEDGMMELPAEAKNRWFELDLPPELLNGGLQMASVQDSIMVQKALRDMVVDTADAWYIWAPIGDYQIESGYYTFDVTSSPEKMRMAMVQSIDNFAKFMTAVATVGSIPESELSYLLEDLNDEKEMLMEISSEELATMFPTFSGTVWVNQDDYEDIKISLMGEMPGDETVLSIEMRHMAEGLDVVVHPVIDGIDMSEEMGQFTISSTANGAYSIVLPEDEGIISGMWNELEKSIIVEMSDGYFDDEYNWVETGLQPVFTVEMMKDIQTNAWSGDIMIPDEAITISVERLNVDMAKMFFDAKMSIIQDEQIIADMQMISSTKAVNTIDFPTVEASPFSELETIMESMTPMNSGMDFSISFLQ